MTGVPGAERNVAHVALFLSLLTGGGVQRSMLNLAAALAAYGHRVDLVVCHAPLEPGKTVPAGVRLVTLRPASSMWGRLLAFKADPEGVGELLKPVLLPLKASTKVRYLPDLVHYLRRERPEALLSAMTQSNLVALWARHLAGVPSRIVVTEHSMLSSYVDHHRRKWRWRYLPALVRRTYAFADAVVTVSQAVAEDLVATTGISRQRITPIPNPIVTAELREQAQSRPCHPWFTAGAPPVVLGVGRLAEPKDFITLLQAFAQVGAARPARLLILGEGPQRPALQRLVRELGITDAVAMPGWVDNPISYMAGAGVLVLSTRWEGLPGVLIEALASGCPVVATACPGGTAEILDDGAYGRLVPVGDVQAMVAAIVAALDTPRDPLRLRRRADEYSAERVAGRYIKLLLGPRCAVAAEMQGCCTSP